MKMYLLLILSAIMLSTMTAYHFIGLQSKTSASNEEIENIFYLFEQFSSSNKPRLEIDILSMYPQSRYVQLFTSINVIDQARNSQRSYIIGGCQNRNEVMSRVYFTKSDIWEDFRCRKIDFLPYRFFENPPYMHETGMSFAYIALQMEPNTQERIDWIKDHINLFHVTELSKLPKRALEPQFEVLSMLNKRELDQIVKGLNYILSEKYFLVKDTTNYSRTYKVFDATLFESFLKNHNYFVKPARKDETCYFRLGSYCYERDSVGILILIRQSSIVILTSSIIILGLISLMLLKKIRETRHEEERKRHALRVLTHELRTPIANLILLTEQISKKSIKLENEVLEDFIKIESEVYRLKRLAEKSTSYLHHQEGRSIINLYPQPVDSLFQFVTDIVEDYDEKKVILKLIGEDFKVSLDVYWFTMCLKNLIENALKHGKGLVTVYVKLEKQDFIVEVADEGNIGNIKLNSLMNNHNEILPSSGLGLGLSLVNKILTQMNGRLILKSAPTRFLMIIKREYSDSQGML